MNTHPIFGDKYRQTGLRTCTMQVAGGWLAEVSLPNHVEGNAPIWIETDKPIPEEKLAWWIKQATRQVFQILARQRGCCAEANQINYLENAA